MMSPYPFFGFPPFRRPYPYYPNYPLHNNAMKNKNKGANSSSPSDFSENKQENFQKNLHTPNSYNNHTFGYQLHDSKINASDHSHYSNHSKIKSSNDFQNFEAEQEDCFEIFGLKLHFDDLLLIALLFFLYQEDVKDSYLYIALILLLLS